MKVLIAEDDIVQRKHLIARLKKTGHEIVEAADGNEAWAELEKGEAKMLITDWMMPGLDGLSLIRKLRQAPPHGYVYAVILTAKEEKTDILEGLNAGADDYLTKPFDQAELIARLRIGERILDLEARLLEMATRDQLTGLLTRRAFISRFEAEAKRACREGTIMGLVMLDIDDFKLVNDGYGHSVGDMVLKYTSETLLRAARPYDVVCRWGGEEFLLLLPNCDLEAAAAAAERLRANLSVGGVILDDGRRIGITASFGVAIHESSRDPCDYSLDALVRSADKALYEAKAAGKNTVRSRPAAL